MSKARTPNLRRAFVEFRTRWLALGITMLLSMAVGAVFNVLIVAQVTISLPILFSFVLVSGALASLYWLFLHLIIPLWARLHETYVNHRTTGPVSSFKQSQGVFGQEFGVEELIFGKTLIIIFTEVFAVLLALWLLAGQNDWPAFLLLIGLFGFVVSGYFVGRVLVGLLDHAKALIALRAQMTNQAQNVLQSAAGRRSLTGQSRLMKALMQRTERAVLRHRLWAMTYGWFTGEFHNFIILGFLAALTLGAINQDLALTISATLLVIGARMVRVMRSASYFNNMHNSMKRLYDNLIPGPAQEFVEPMPGTSEAVGQAQNDGSVAFIMGRSGIGKSTSLKALAAHDARITYIDQHVIELWEGLDDMLADYAKFEKPQGSVLVLDELLNTLDDQGIERVVSELTRLQIPTVIVLHDADNRWPAERYPIFNLEAENR